MPNNKEKKLHFLFFLRNYSRRKIDLINLYKKEKKNHKQNNNTSFYNPKQILWFRKSFGLKKVLEKN
jgi:hypothetical protein